MKKIKRILTMLLAMILVLGMSMSALADETPGAPIDGDPVDPDPAVTTTASITINPNNTAGDTQSLAIDYTYYQILEADIETDAVVDESTGAITTKGKVAYFVTTQDRATAIEGTNLFNVTKVDGQNKWYVELKSTSTTADQIVDALKTMDKSSFATGTFDKQAGEAKAESGDLAPGYYYIESSLGTKIAVQTLTNVTINEKNSYPTIKKSDDKDFAPIDGTVTYTVTVEIPATVKDKSIVIYDTITKGLTLDTDATVTGAVAEPEYKSATLVFSEEKADGSKVYTITIPAATVLANKGQTLVFTYTAKVNEDAVVMVPEKNDAYLTYDNYTTVKVEVDVKTLAFDVQKVDGSDKTTILAGAEFELYDAETDGNKIEVVLKEAASANNGQVNIYRVAKAGETGVKIQGGTFRIEGLDKTTYFLEETKAPTGYNRLEARIRTSASETTAPSANIDYKIENNKGATLPSTGGIGTTIFYVLGSILVVGAGLILVTKRRMNVQ